MKIRRKIELELKIEQGKLQLVKDNIQALKEQIGKTHEENEILDTFIQLRTQTEKIISIYEDLLKYED